MRLAGGTGALIAALAGRLPEDRMHRQAQVTHLACSGHGAVLTYTDENGETQSVAAAQVILALPPRLLAETVTFEPALPPEAVARWRNTATWMAPHAKFFALYDRAFWRDAGLSGTAQSQAGPLVEIHDATTAAGGAALFGFVGLPADHRQTVGEGAMKAAAVAQLVRLFGPEAGSPRATLWKDWTADPLTATRADRVAGGHPYPSHQPWLTGPWAQHVVLGGSETSSSDPGYLAGALEAGGQAAQAVSRRLAEAPALAAARSAH
jgi:monoamine oxidase